MTYKEILKIMHEEKDMTLPDVRRLQILARAAKQTEEDEQNSKEERLLAKAVRLETEYLEDHLVKEFQAFIAMQFENMKKNENSVNTEVQQ